MLRSEDVTGERSASRHQIQVAGQASPFLLRPVARFSPGPVTHGDSPGIPHSLSLISARDLSPPLRFPFFRLQGSQG